MQIGEGEDEICWKMLSFREVRRGRKSEFWLMAIIRRYRKVRKIRKHKKEEIKTKRLGF